MLSRVARRAVRGLQVVIPRTRGVHVLAYHLVGGDTGTAVDVSTARFEADLDALAGRVVPLSDAVQGHVAPGSVVLTFDDAYANFYEVAYPRLLERALPAVLYVPTGFVDGGSPAPIRGTEGLAPCSWDQLKQLQAGGLITVGAHTVTHPSLTGISPEQVTRELAVSRARIEDRLGVAVPHFCYPRGLWSKPLERLVQAHYQTAVIGGGAAVTASTPRTRLQRISLRSDSPPLPEIVASQVWLEERLADQVRRLRPA